MSAKKQIDDGGPAFPHKEKDVVYTMKDAEPWLQDVQHPGLTIRDYFAAHIASGFASSDWLPNQCDGENDYNVGLAKRSYAIADAMIEARKHK